MLEAPPRTRPQPAASQLTASQLTASQLATPQTVIPGLDPGISPHGAAPRPGPLHQHRDPAKDLAACRAMLCGGSKSFFLASLLLPRRVLDPATALYAFCRAADDLIDGQAGGHRSQPHSDPATALATLQARLDGIYASQPTNHPADRALATVVAQHRLPRALLDNLLEGFAWDAEGRQYETLPDLLAYAARVAGTVGAMMAVLMGVRDPETVARACDLGLAMQLSNIARDVGEDARAGRLYLPRTWLRDAGIDPDAFLADPTHTPALGSVVTRLLQAADTFYLSAETGIAALPWSCRPGIGAASRLYAAIGHQVARAGGNAIDGRAIVPAWGKLALLARAVAHTAAAAAVTSLPAASPAANAAPNPAANPAPLATRHLVAAVAATPAPKTPPGRLVWLLELFADLDTRQAIRPGPI